ncbi:MAG: chemotaxis-specific protein-glutamate methyltransferase CheB [Microcoleaceae cyanobacterium]
MSNQKIRVLIVEDSPVAVLILKRILNSCPEIEVVGTAVNGIEGLAILQKVDPNVICTDLHMAKMDGLEFTKAVMRQFPRPILVISTSVQDNDQDNVFRLLAAGAVDVFPKPQTGLSSDYDEIRQELINRIRVLAGVKVFTIHNHRQDPIKLENRSTFSPQTTIISREKTNFPANSANSAAVTPSRQIRQPRHQPIKLIAIGASTGGPQALHTILTNLPANLKVPVVCVQHISEGFLQGLVSWLAIDSTLPIKIARPGEIPLAGNIYFAPDCHHLELDGRGCFACSIAPPVGGHRPSVTTTFNSVAKFYGASVAGVLLTGMGRDGADGLLSITKAGGFTIAQDEASSVVFGMPKEAIALGAAQYVLNLTSIVPLLLNHLN